MDKKEILVNNAEVNRKIYVKVNSVREAYPKCFAVHLLEFEILQSREKTKQ